MLLLRRRSSLHLLRLLHLRLRRRSPLCLLGTRRSSTDRATLLSPSLDLLLLRRRRTLFAARRRCSIDRATIRSSSLELLAPAALLLVAGCNAGRYRRPVAIGPTALFFARCGRRGVAAALKFPPTLFSAAEVAWGNSRGAGPILRPPLVLTLRRLRRRGDGLLAPVLKVGRASCRERV